MTKKPNIYEILRINPNSNKIKGVFIESWDELRKLIETEFAKDVHTRNYTKLSIIVIYLREVKDTFCYTFESDRKEFIFPKKLFDVIAEYTILDVYFEYDETDTLRANFAIPIHEFEHPIAYIVPYKQSMRKVENALDEIHARWRV